MTSIEQGPLNVDEIQGAQVTLQAIATEVGKHFYAPEEFINRFTVAVAADGHIIMESTPGTSKTVLAKGAATMIGGTFGRIQGVPDIRPTDITLSREPDYEEGGWKLVEGPVFNDVLLADEFNRLAPKTQSALLQAMEERQVTGFGVTRDLPRHFKVIGTQNPYSTGSGNNQLPSSTLDRFRYGLTMPVPSKENKAKAWQREDDQPEFKKILNDCGQDLTALRATANKVGYHDDLTDRVFAIEEALGRLQASDGEPFVSRGSHKEIMNSMRPGRAIKRLAQMAVLLDGRAAVKVEDINELAHNVYAHRIKPTHPAIDEGLDAQQLVQMAVEAA
jgi:MoxR-like ATPase